MPISESPLDDSTEIVIPEITTGNSSLTDEEIAKAMHIIITHWHTTVSPDIDERAVSYPDNSIIISCYYIPAEDSEHKPRLMVNDGKGYQERSSFNIYDDYVDCLSGDSVRVSPKAYTYDGKPAEDFAGYAVLAGHSAVTENEADENIVVKYDKDTRLVKIQAFYKTHNITVAGTSDDTVFGADGATEDSPEKDTAYGYVYVNDSADGGVTHKAGDVVKNGSKLADEAYINAHNTEFTVVESEEAGKGEPKAVMYTKLYSTEPGLHTDKTARAVGTDGRTFDLDLESWYIGDSLANVGMVLDASGSMAFTSDTAEPINAQSILNDINEKETGRYALRQQIEAKKINYDSGNYPNENNSWDKFFLDKDEIELLLDKRKTDNSKLGYSGYRYFIYDSRTDTSENVPIAYWDGTGITTESITTYTVKDEVPEYKNVIGYYAFDNNLNESLTQGVGAEVLSEKCGATGPIDFSTTSTDSAEFSGNSLKLTKDNKGIKIDLGKLSEFTISFKLNMKWGVTNNFIYLGAEKNPEKYLILYNNKDGDSRIKIDNYVKGKKGKPVANVNKVLGANNSEHWITLTISDNGNGTKTLKTYLDGNIGVNSDSNVSPNDGTSPANSVVLDDDICLVINGFNTENADEIKLDDLFIYRGALDDSNVKKLYSYYSDYQRNETKNPILDKKTENTSYIYNKDKRDQILGILDKLTEVDINGKGEGYYSGWYYMNSSSSWSSDYNNSEVGTAKQFKPLQKPEKSGNYVYTTKDETIKNIPFSGEVCGHNAAGKPPIEYTPYTPDEITPIKFFINENGYLCCFWCSSSEAGKYGWSPVYMLDDSESIKTEALQQALGSFVTKLGEYSPDSKVSAVRFSSNNVSNGEYGKLLVLNWTKDLRKSVGLLNIDRGDRSSTGCNDDGEYNYGLTGNTATFTGIEAFEQLLSKNGDKGDNVKKYLIVFTDGMDTIFYSTNEDVQKYKYNAREASERLTADGYEIYTVMLAGGPVVKGGAQYDRAERFLVNHVAGNDNRFYYAKTVEELTKSFTNDILNFIADNLEDYNVQDYIDPRFDLVDADGNVWKLGANGEVIKDGETKPTLLPAEIVLSLSSEVDESARKATLHYDSENDLYYLVWSGQTIPGSPQSSAKLPVWNATVTVQAKEDFVGGNEILTNGPAEKMNYVYFGGNETEKADANASSGTDRSKYNEETNPHPSKGFPRTTVNVKIPGIEMDGGNQVIYMGEDLTSSSVAAALVEHNADENNIYFEFLERYAEKNGRTLEEVLEDIASSGDDGLSFEYSYLPAADGSVQTGKLGHDGDLLGTLTFTWGDSSTYPEGKTTDTNQRQSALSVTYTPYTTEQRKGEEAVGTEAAKNFNDKLITETVYEWRKEAAGDPQKDNKTNSGTYTTDIVKGEILLRVKLSSNAVQYLKTQGEVLKYSANIFKDGGKDSIGEFTVSIPAENLDTTLERDKDNDCYYAYVSFENAVLDTDPGAKGLPTGVYTFSENADGEKTKCLNFGDIVILDKDAVNSASGEYKTYLRDVDDGSNLYNYYSDFTKNTVSGVDNSIILGKPEEGDEENAYLYRRYGLIQVAAELGTGKLTVKKEIKGTAPAADSDKEFTFNVTLTDVGGDLYNGTLMGHMVDKNNNAYASESVTVTGGKCTVTLKAGESYVFENIPFGTTYTVVEAEDKDYEPEYTYNETIHAITHEADSLATVKNSTAGGSVSLTKQVVDSQGAAISDDETEFTFGIEVTYPADEVPTTAPEVKIDNVTVADIKWSAGFTSAEITLTHGHTATVSGLPYGSEVKFTEKDVASGYKFEKIEYSPDGGAAAAKIRANVVKISGQEITVPILERENGTATYYNINVAPTINVEKKVQLVADDGTAAGPLSDNLSADPGDTLQYQIEVTATGDPVAVAQNVEITDEFADTWKTGMEPVPVSVEMFDGENNPIEGRITSPSTYGKVNVWTVAKMVPGDRIVITYRVKLPDEFTADSIKNTVTVPDDSDTVTVTEKPVQLIISKSLENSRGETIDEEREFNIVVTLSEPVVATASEGEPKSVYITVTSSIGSEKIVKFTYGTPKKLEITSGEALSLSGIPAGTTYEVTETGYDHYTETVENAIGTIAASQIKSARVINVPNPARVSIPVTKTFTGTFAEGTDYSFDITFEAVLDTIDGASAADVKRYSATATYTVKDGKVTAPTADPEIVITGLDAGVYEFTVSEKPGNETGLTYDDKTYKVTVTVIDGGTGYLTATPTGIPAGGIAFENEYKPEPVKANIEVRKEISGREWLSGDNGAYSFTLKGSDGAPMPADASAKKNTDGQLIGFGEITFTETGTYTYTITEDELDGDAPENITKDGGTVTATVEVTEADGKLSAAVSYSYSDGENTESDNTFTNVYTPDPATAVISVTKTISGREWMADRDNGAYSFTLKAVTDGAPMPANAVVTNDGDTASFGKITFTKPGTYEYTLTETGVDSTKAPSVSRDETEYTVRVTVDKDEITGELSTAAAYYVKGEAKTEAVFNNVYEPDSVSISMTAKKRVDGRNMTASDVYGFTLTPIDNAPMPAGKSTLTATNNGENITFDEITFTEPGTYAYTITENAHTVPSVTHDDRTVFATVVVTDDGSGKLMASGPVYIGGEGDGNTFVNYYKVGSLSVTKFVEGEGADKDDVFEFAVTFTSETGADLSGINADGNVTLSDNTYTFSLKHGETIKFTDIPEDTAYEVAETSHGDYTPTADDYEGKIVAGAEATATFVNHKNRRSLTVTKKVVVINDDGTTVDEDSGPFSFTLSLTNLPATLSEDITLNGDAIKLQDGKYTFELKDGETAVFKGIPNGAEYEVTENLTDNQAKLYVQTSVGESGTFEDDSDFYAAFVNTRTVNRGTLSVSKIVAGENLEAEDTLRSFEFTLMLSKLPDSAQEGEYTTVSEGEHIGWHQKKFTLKDGETFTVSDIPDGTEYYIEESAASGFIMNEPKHGTVAAGSGAAEVFVNKKSHSTGNLSVTKFVTAEPGAVPPTGTECFKFTVTLCDLYDTDKVLTDIDGVYGDMTFTDGVAEFELRAGQSVTATGLPSEAVYKVSEETAAGYRTESAHAVGVIPAKNATAEAVFTNTKLAPEPELGGLSVTKTVVSDDAQDFTREFPITVTLSDTGINGVYGDMMFVNGSASFSLSHNQTVTAEGLPVGISYTVDEGALAGEVKSSDFDKNVIYPADGPVIVKDIISHVTVQNVRHERTGAIHLSKTVVGLVAGDPRLEQAYTFTVTLSGPALTDETAGDIAAGGYRFVKAAENVYVCDGITLKGGSHFEISNIPEGTEYTITEAPGDGSYTSHAHGNTGIIAPDGDMNAVFVNSYTTDAVITVTKSVTGVENDTTPFTFTMALSELPNETTPDTAFTLNTDTNEYIGTITLKDGETFAAVVPSGTTYRVSENIDPALPYSLTAPANNLYQGTAEAVSPVHLRFVNAYTAKFGSLVVSKTLIGDENGGDFSFTVTLANFPEGFAPPARFTAVGGGSYTKNITVPAGTFVKIDGIPEGTLYSVIENDVLNYSNSTPPETVALYAVTGQSGAISSEHDSVAAFVNIKTPKAEEKYGSLIISKIVSGSEPDTDETFTFTVQLTKPPKDSADFTPYAPDNETVLYYEKNITLKHGSVKTVSGIPAGAKYTVTEQTPEGYTTVYLSANTGTIQGNASAAVIVENIKEETVTPPEKPTGTLVVSKTVTGTEPYDGREFDFTVTLTGLDGEDTMTFGGCQFNKSGDEYIGTFKLAHDGTKILSGIPAGVSFEVVETNSSPYTVTYHSSSAVPDLTGSGVSGIITENTAVSVIVENRLDETPADETGSVIVHKTLIDPKPGDEDREFSFVITLSGLAGLRPGSPDVTYGGVTYTFDENKPGFTYSYGFTLKNGESKLFTDLPAYAEYVVSEVNPKTVTSDSVYELASKDGDSGMIYPGAAVDALFVNKRSDINGALSVTKAVAGAYGDKKARFDFTLTLTGIDESELEQIGYAVTKSGGSVEPEGLGFKLDSSSAENKTAVYNFTLAHAETITVFGIPDGCEYEVVETDSKGHGTTYVTPATGTVSDGAVSQVIVTNAKCTATDVGRLTVIKAVAGDYDESVKFGFTVTLKDDDGNVRKDITAAYGDMEFTEGVAKFELGHGEYITAEDLPKGIKYEVSETGYDGYILEKSYNEEGVITADTNTMAVFINKAEEAIGSLTVSKTVVDDTDPNADHSDEEFGFKVTLGEALSGDFGGMTFKNGTAEFKLKPGESLTATGLPDGIYYEVTEEAAEGYDSSCGSPSGYIKKDTIARAEYVNAVIPPEKPTLGDLTVSKTVVRSDGKALSDDENNASFEFTVTLGDSSVNGLFGDEKTGMEFKNGVATFTLKNGEHKTAVGLPANTLYVVAEKPADGYTPSYTGNVGYIKDGELSEAAFTNTLQVAPPAPEPEYGSLSVSKTVTGTAGETARRFGFTVILGDASVNGTYGGMTFTNGVAKFTLAHGEKAAATGLPAGITYSVVEDFAEGYIVSSAGSYGVIPANSTAEASFVNHRDFKPSPTPPEVQGTGSLTVTKTVRGDGAEYGREFEFRVILKGPSGREITGSYVISGYSLAGEFRSGDSFRLKHGESVTISGLPVGTSYEVIEIGADGYSVSSTGSTGVISRLGCRAEFVNSKNAEVEIPTESGRGVSQDENVAVFPDALSAIALAALLGLAFLTLKRVR